MTKRHRQGEILRLIDSHEIGTQAGLVDALATAGIDVAQTTVSRDLAELGLVKVRGTNGDLIYARPGTPDLDHLGAMAQVLQRWALSVEASGNLVVIKTPNGFADPVSQALDESGHPEVLATIAGENTVLVVAAEGVTGQSLAADLEARLLEES